MRRLQTNSLPQHTSSPTKPWIKFLRIGIVVFIMGVIIQILVINRLATSGGEISEIERQQSILKLENKALKEKLYSKISLQETKQKAPSLGFEPVKNIEYIK